MSDQATSAVTGSSWTEPLIVALGVVALAVFVLLRDPGLRQPRWRPVSGTPMAGLFLFAAALIAGMLGAQIGLAVAGSEAEEAITLRAMAFMLAGNFIGQGAVLLMVPGLIRSKTVGGDGGRRRVGGLLAVLAGIGGVVLFWPMVMGVAGLVGWIVTLVTGEPMSAIAHGTLARLGEEPSGNGWLIVIVVLVVTATPIWEELMYRGLLQESIRRLDFFKGDSPWLPIGLTSLIFALMHAGVADVRGLAGLFVLSLGFGWIVVKTGRIRSSIVMHAAFNAINLAQVLLR